MATSRRIRGQEISVRFSIDGEPLNSGTFINVTDLSIKQRGDLTDISYLGEKSDDIDFQHHGFDFSLKVDVEDRAAMDYMTSVINAEEGALAHPEIVMTVLWKFRENQTPVVEAFSGVKMFTPETSFGGRKEAITTSFEGKARTRQVITQ